MKSTLKDLNEYMFEAMDRLSNDDLDEAQLEREVKRAEAMAKIAHTVLDMAQLQFKAYELSTEYGKNAEMPALLGVSNSNT